jgi:hypothetical protein
MAILELSVASSDCQPARKLVAVGTEEDNRLGTAAPVRPALYTAPGVLLTLGVGVAPSLISMAAATVMQRDRADTVPKRDRDGLEHCQEWNRLSRFRKSSRLLCGFSLKLFLTRTTRSWRQVIAEPELKYLETAELKSTRPSGSGDPARNLTGHSDSGSALRNGSRWRGQPSRDTDG